jgi:phospholipase/lecithinase/hemolysin
MRALRDGWRAAMLAALLFAVPGCGWLFHKPRPDTDLPPAERPWRVRCTWVLAGRAAPAAPESGWVWAADDAGRRLIVGGALEDGFLRADTLRAASDEDDRDVVPLDAAAATVAAACSRAIARAHPGDVAEVAGYGAAREGEGVEVALAFPHDPSAPRPVSRVVVFGDSLSDPGNLKRRLLVFPLAPYWLGRFADGPVWADHLAHAMGLAVQNHAFGGAVSAPHEDVPSADIVAAIQQGAQHFLTGSVQRYVTDYVERDLALGVVERPRDTVFVVWAGANDYISKEPFSGDIRTLLDTPTGRAGSERVIGLSTSALADVVRRLHAAGARLFVVVNLPDLGRTPAVLYNQSYRPDARLSEDARRIRLARRLSQLTARHNARLARALARLGAELHGETIVLVDTEEAVDVMLAGRAPDGSGRRFDYGFALSAREQALRHGRRVLAVQDRCYTGGYLGTSDPGRTCAEAGHAFFWDSVHPTTRTHCWIAWFVARALAREGLLAGVPGPEAYRAYCDEADPRSGASAARSNETSLRRIRSPRMATKSMPSISTVASSSGRRNVARQSTLQPSPSAKRCASRSTQRISQRPKSFVR